MRTIVCHPDHDPCRLHRRPPAQNWQLTSHSAIAGIVLRYAMNDVEVVAALPTSLGVVVPKGTLVAISPYLIHHDFRFYLDPDLYLPSRHRRRGQSGAAAAPAQLHSPCASRTASARNTAHHSQPGCGQFGTESATHAPPQDPAPVHVAFGAASFRCPGRNFARCQLRLAVAALFMHYDLELVSDGSTPLGGQGGDKCGPGFVHSSKKWLPSWLSESEIPGSHVAARCVTSGDRHARLPQSQPQLLVGVKRPLGSLLVHCCKRTANPAA